MALLALPDLYGDVDVRAFRARFDPFRTLTAHYLLTGMRVARP
jgi:hypothetical protein